MNVSTFGDDLSHFDLPRDPPSLTTIAADLKRIADALEKIAARPEVLRIPNMRDQYRYDVGEALKVT
jgi:hypothetical protein